jgi:two-component system sensor histidine kinase KdpD
MQTELSPSVNNRVWFAAAIDQYAIALHRAGDELRRARQRRDLHPAIAVIGACMAALMLVAGTTICLVVAVGIVELGHVSMAYLIPVLVAATTLGVTPAIVAAVSGVAASAFIFYPPIFDFRVADTQQFLDLPLFLIVAAVTGQLAARGKANAMVAQKHADETRALYAFSKQLAAAADAAEIYSAIEEHLSLITECRVLYFGADGSRSQESGLLVPEALRRALADYGSGEDRSVEAWVDDPVSGARWHIRPLSKRNAAFGTLAIDVGRISADTQTSLDERIDRALADAATRLERLDVARMLGEAKLREEAETFRAALIGSVTHGLRTPLASIMGSASILVQAPAIAQHPHLSALAGIIRDETERLNDDIQKLLDASRISSAAVRAHMTWADPADIVNAAVAGLGRVQATHSISVRLSDSLGLVQIDPVLIEQALRLIIDNAIKYSGAGSSISVEAQGGAGETKIAVSDQGIGLSQEDCEQIFERFYRGPRTRDTTTGSGLGLWIARAFITACGGRVEATSRGEGRGTMVTIVLPETETTAAHPSATLDD